MKAWLCSSVRPGTSHCFLSCTGAVPARRSMTRERQSMLSSLAAATRSALDAAARELGRVQQARQLVLRQVRHLRGDVPNRLAFFVSLLRNRGALVVADDRVQRGAENRAAIELLGEAQLV